MAPYNIAAMTAEVPLLEARDLVMDFPGVRAVDGLSISIARGECLGLLGPNGAGKTTTIEILEGVLQPSSGRVLFNGRPADRDFHASAGIQFQSTALQDFLTVGETLNLFHGLYGGPDRRAELIEVCALDDILKRDNRKLSGGQRQRLLLAIALINDPVMLFLDEPTTGLDPQSRRNFWDVIAQIKRRNTTILLTTHYMEEAHVLCDRIAIVDHGQIIADGSPDKLLKDHYDDVILQLPRHEFQPAADRIQHNVLDGGEFIEVRTADVNATIGSLTEINCVFDREISKISLST